MHLWADGGVHQSLSRGGAEPATKWLHEYIRGLGMGVWGAFAPSLGFCCVRFAICVDLCVGEHLNRQKGRSSNRALISLILWLTVWYIQGGVWEHWKCFQNCIIAVKCNIFWWHCRGVVQSLLPSSWSVRRQLFCAMQGHRCGLLTCRHVQYNTVACFPLLTWYDCLRGRILTCTFSVHISDRIQAEIILSHQNSLSLNMAMEKSQRERGGREKEGGYLSLSLSAQVWQGKSFAKISGKIHWRCHCPPFQLPLPITSVQTCVPGLTYP